MLYRFNTCINSLDNMNRTSNRALCTRTISSVYCRITPKISKNMKTLNICKGDTYHRMKIPLSIDWNISECPLNAHGMFTESIVHWPFSGHPVPLNAAECQAHFSDHSVIFFNFQEKKSKYFHQIRGFKVILLWMTMHEIKKRGKVVPTGRVEPGYSVPWCSLCHAASYRVWVNTNTYMYTFFSRFFLVFDVCLFLHNFFIIDVILIDSFLCMHHVGFNVLKISPLWLTPVYVYFS